MAELQFHEYHDFMDKEIPDDLCNTIYLQNILHEEKNTIHIMKEKLNVNGWCFVKLSDDLITYIDHAHSLLDKFLSLDSKVKNKYSFTYGTGYYELYFKEQLHLLTGKNLELISQIKTESQEEENIKKSIITFSVMMDGLMKKLSLILNNDLFHLSEEQLSTISIFNEKNTGLLDVVKYKPDIDREFYVEEHIDPGLFSFNIFSNAHGMQFFDNRTNMWVNLKKGYGAIFCGNTADKYSNIPAALHRVKTEKNGRFSIWYEVGVDYQIPQNINKIVPKDISENETIEEKIRVKVKKWEKNYFFDMNSNYTIFELKEKIETWRGLPHSKIMIRPPGKVNLDPVTISKINVDDMIVGNIKEWNIINGVLYPNNEENSSESNNMTINSDVILDNDDDLFI